MSGLADKLLAETWKMARNALGASLTDDGVSLMLRIDHCCKHKNSFAVGELTNGERRIWTKWQREGIVERNGRDIKVTLPFYELMCRALFDAYVETIDDEGDEEE
jgi:hypothetical protein